MEFADKTLQGKSLGPSEYKSEVVEAAVEAESSRKDDYGGHEK